MWAAMPTVSFCVDDDGWHHCSTCHAYHGDDDNDGNSTDTDYDEAAVAEMDADELYNYVGSEPENRESSKLEYLLVKRRFRHFSSKPSRAERRPRRAKGKGKGQRPTLQRQRKWVRKELLPDLEGSALAGGRPLARRR